LPGQGIDGAAEKGGEWDWKCRQIRTQTSAMSGFGEILKKGVNSRSIVLLKSPSNRFEEIGN
jgi:hypothetical protein